MIFAANNLLYCDSVLVGDAPLEFVLLLLDEAVIVAVQEEVGGEGEGGRGGGAVLAGLVPLSEDSDEANGQIRPGGRGGGGRGRHPRAPQTRFW